MSEPSPAELLDAASAAARVGGSVLLEGLTRPKHVSLKNERTSIVTWADVTAQEKILRLLAERYPDHGVLAEEGGGPQEGAYVWLVDPLDGTSNYASGVPFACCSVAVRDSNGVVAGAIFDPFRGELFTAARGRGAWLDGARLAVASTSSLSAALVCTGVQSDDPGALETFGRRIVALCAECRGVRCLGSPALCLAYVAAGRTEAFLERDATYAWDVGAGSMLITEAGGRIEDLDGGPLNLGPGLANVLATNGHVHAALAGVVATAEGRP